MRHALLVCIAFSALTLGCKKSDTTGDDTAADAPPLTGEVYTLTWPTQTIGTTIENTQCIWMRLNNTAPITQKEDDEVTLPDHVAYTLEANQMIKIELHYINTTDAPAPTNATINFYAADPATITDEAGVLFAGSLDIDIPAQSQATLHQFLTLPAADLDMSASKVFAITGHTHRLGTQVTVGTAASRTAAVTQVYAPAPFSWSEPLTTTYATPFSVPAGGGFDFQCDWTNTTNSTVKFGESANQEMCFFWVYYYPAQNPKVCAHTQQYGGQNGTDLCCPSSNSLCAAIGSHL
jgi:hypothetical protein